MRAGLRERHMSASAPFSVGGRCSPFFSRSRGRETRHRSDTWYLREASASALLFLLRSEASDILHQREYAFRVLSDLNFDAVSTALNYSRISSNFLRILEIWNFNFLLISLNSRWCAAFRFSKITWIYCWNLKKNQESI